MSKDIGISIADIQAARKTLNRGEITEAKEGKSVFPENKETRSELESLRQIYLNHEGDIEKIFIELQCNPRKALKHRPKDENEFADKFYKGFYTVIDDDCKYVESNDHK